jgi:hypothetical protein
MRDGDGERLTGNLVRRPQKVHVIWLGRDLCYDRPDLDQLQT